jgi:hypothetical protein
MDQRTKERLAANEDLFRSINEEINGVAAGHDVGREQTTYEFICECSDLSCMEYVLLTLEEYAHVRAVSTRFVVVKGHVIKEIETVVEAARDHVVIEKDGYAGVVAIELDTHEDAKSG